MLPWKYLGNQNQLAITIPGVFSNIFHDIYDNVVLYYENPSITLDFQELVQFFNNVENFVEIWKTLPLGEANEYLSQSPQSHYPTALARCNLLANAYNLS